MSVSKKPRAATGEALGILNPYGDMWTYQTFETEPEAKRYLADFWRGISGDTDLSEFKVVPVKIRVSAIFAPAPTQAAADRGGRDG